MSYNKIIEYIATKFPYEHRNDLKQEMFLEYHKKKNSGKYDSDKAEFDTWVKTRLYFHCVSYMRKINPNYSSTANYGIKTVSIQALSERNDSFRIFELKSEENIVEDHYLKDLNRRFISTLSDREYEVLKMRFLENQDYEDISVFLRKKYKILKNRHWVSMKIDSILDRYKHLKEECFN